MSAPHTEPLWTRAFVLLCVVQFLGYAQHFVLQPTIPIYVTQLGASPFVVGLVMASFAATSMLLRPLVGYWSDRWSEAGVMISGLLIQGASVLLCYLPFVGTTMLANSCRGVGWASVNSGGYALLAQRAPAARRGEASGYYSGAQGSATIILPALALWLIDAPFGGFRVVFAVSMTIAVCGAALGLMLREGTSNAARQQRNHHAGPWWRKIVRIPEKDILLASGLLFGLHVTLPAVAGFLVLYARQLGIEHFGWYYVVSGATSLIARPLLGWASDKIGRGAAIAVGLGLEALALCVVVNATTLSGMLVSGALYMTGSAIGTAATLALALEHANPERRGQVIATYSMAYPLSAGVGSLLTGAAIQLAGYYWMFLFAAALNIPGLIVVYKNRASLK
ncbi:MAG: MFS transporter [Deltaproteobacteria bacterium]|nr:MFS transporter [Deltaproteobacteria bacterium]